MFAESAFMSHMVTTSTSTAPPSTELSSSIVEHKKALFCIP